MNEVVTTLAVSVDAATRQLNVSYTPIDGIAPPDRAALQAELEAGGWAECALDEATITAFLDKIRNMAEPLSMTIGAQVDGSFDISVSPSRMCAWLTLVPPRGGKPVPAEKVREAIRSRNISHGLHEAELADALLKGQCNELIIAEGEEPESGIPARFDSLLEALKAQRLEHDEGDVVDYRDLGNLIVVDPGTPLMKRTPAVQGKNGVDVFDRPVPAKPVPDPPFNKGLPGAAPDEKNPDLLLATIAGAPSLTENGVSVNPLVDVVDVDLSTGNITFDGTIQVKGDIKAGMSVRVQGDVVVSGTIEAAEIIAGGNVVCKGGIIGKAEHGSTADGEPTTARIQCNGSVQAKFIEHAIIEAAKSIQAESGIRQSELSAGDCIVIGKPGSNQGSLIGGHARARLLVRAPTLGSPSGTPTLVQVGFNPYLSAERTQTEQQRKRKLEELAKLKQLLAFFDQNPAKAVGGMREKAEHTRSIYETEIKSFDAKLSDLAEQLEMTEGASIEAPKRIHGGVNLQFGQKLMQVVEDKAGGRVRLVDDQIVIG
ncbi:FapA family protein [Chitinimonas sp.]|uniref:DUF342 domain-containing protein n=1 Tax=Chitinimonas sp. TaxID=1934313 RepID=UPI002F92D1EB